MNRRRVPNRRMADSLRTEAGGLSYASTVGRFTDGGGLAEISLSNGKAGSPADACARDSAVVCSIALQCGVPAEVIARALLRDSKGRPETPLGVALHRVIEG